MFRPPPPVERASSNPVETPTNADGTTWFLAPVVVGSNPTGSTHPIAAITAVIGRVGESL